MFSCQGIFDKICAGDKYSDEYQISGLNIQVKIGFFPSAYSYCKIIHEKYLQL